MKAKSSSQDATYPTAQMNELFAAILTLKTVEEAQAFFRDLLTVAELQEFANRWQIVKLLSQGNPYTVIAEQLNVSTATVTRVAQWLYAGRGGYETIARRLFAKPTGTSRFKLRGKRTWL